MKPLLETAKILMIRIDFSDEGAWRELCEFASSPSFRSKVHAVNDVEYRNATIGMILSVAPPAGFLAVADAETFATPDRPLLVIFPKTPGGGGIRVSAEDLWTVENSICQADVTWGL